MDGFGGESEITCRSDNHHPTVWGDHFLAYANLSGANEWEEKERKNLKEEVRKMLVISPSKSLQKLGLINKIQFLGVAYHFEHEIEESLSEIYNGYEEWIGEFGESHGLHVVALSFRLLRQQGYYVSSNVFRKFTEDQGNYNKALVNDMWWKELDMANELPFARDRVVELYFWCLGMYFEPQYNVARNILTKVLCFVSITDDIYDIYGTLHELTLLTNAIERWNIDAAEKLVPYMKLFYTALLDFYNEVEKELAKENKSFRVNFAISEMKKLVRAYFQEAKWYHGNTVPRMEEYMMNGIHTSTVPDLSTACWLGMGDEATKEAFEWITTEPPIVVASSIIGRLLNDIASHEEEAYMEIRKIIEDNWKDLNQRCLKPTTVPSSGKSKDSPLVPRVLLMPVLNLSRKSEFFYKDEDAYTSSKNNLKDIISTMLVDPIKV
ncbi:hypothetical protein H5410_038026 [Solanum commersonii]|uniref:Sesquiterpene synthase n=1 Tax=Solanum commersonii TaxID=4109 RepID=A0A9J5Y9J7_SOLCO|nr:hypothetical protein H5410_038026 [Solanum commersonii]